MLAYVLAGAALVAAVALVFAGRAGCFANKSLGDLEPATVLHVSDGDTLYVRLASGEEGFVRLIGVDAPESVNPDETLNTPEGEAAAAFVRSLVQPGQTVWLAHDVTDHDQYGRWLRYVWLEVPDDVLSADEVRTKMLQGILVSAGHAQVKGYAPDTSYDALFRKLASSV